ncbi:MAG: hypothetical protein DLD55_03290 [candidate division SR1 bacterium]|nr:MAG: hypothetical protein DLD55_03290 [candidate division SR1 bacterium]
MFENIQYSFMFAWTSLSTFVQEQPFLFVIIAITLLWSVVSQFIKARLKRKYIIPYEGSGNTHNHHFYLQYYKRVQYINIFGVILLVFLLLTYFLTKDKAVGTVFAVGIGALFITFQTFTVSFFTYFLLVKNYEIGDTIRVGAAGLQGEILSMKSLYMGIAGKNDFGEHTGEFYIIPNHHIWANPITKVDLALNHYSKHSLTIVYDPEIFLTDFKSFVDHLEKFLDDLLPVRAASQVSYFKTYIGVRYKMDFGYDKDGKATIWIGCIAKRMEGIQIKKQILAFVEQKKKTE